ncbi:MAG: hypothetical protein D6755_07970, partial [Anaerolineae bacterium]
LGNFVLRPESNWRWHTLGFGIEVRFYSRWALPEIYYHPYEITPAGLRAIEGEAGQTFVYQTLPELSEPLKDPARLQVLWDACADEFLRRGGLADLLQTVGALGGTRWGTASLWRGAASRMPGNTLKGRVFRRLLMGAASLLGAAPPHWTVSPETARQAAILRNRFDTPAHQQLWLAALRRIRDGTFGDSPPWAVEALKQWLLP